MSSILLDPTRVVVQIWTNKLARSQEFFEAIGMKTFTFSTDHVLYGSGGMSLLVHVTHKTIGFNEPWACLPHTNRDCPDADFTQQSTLILVRNLHKVVTRLSDAAFRLQQSVPFEFGRGFHAVQAKDHHGRNFFLVE